MGTDNSTTASSINTRNIALAGLFTAAALIASFIQIPIFPAAPWLQYDPSGVICLIAALAFGPKMGVAVAIISWIPRFFLDPFGMLMGCLNTCSFVAPAAFIYRRGGCTRKSSLAGMLAGGALAVALSIGGNILITPLYTPIATEAVVAMIIPILLPFNALKMVISVIAGQALLAPCTNALNARTRS